MVVQGREEEVFKNLTLVEENNCKFKSALYWDNACLCDFLGGGGELNMY